MSLGRLDTRDRVAYDLGSRHAARAWRTWRLFTPTRSLPEPRIEGDGPYSPYEFARDVFIEPDRDDWDVFAELAEAYEQGWRTFMEERS